MIEFLVIVLLGIVEGITEFLPISSTGHLLIVEKIIGHPQTDLFNIFIQLGAIMAVVVIYWKKLYDLAIGWRDKTNQIYLAKLGCAFVITVLLVLALGKFKLPETITPVAWAMILGAFAIMGAEYILARKTPNDELTWPVAIAAGVAQVVAGVFPGTSRSAATIVSSMLLGQSRKGAAEFSFILGIPTMFAASAHSVMKLYKEHGTAAFKEESFMALGVGFIVSAVVAFVVVKWLLHYIQTHNFLPFAYYRLVVGFGLLIWFGFFATASAPAVDLTPKRTPVVRLKTSPPPAP